MTGEARPVVIAGIPRSGSTWTARVLAQIARAPLLHEPDNDKRALGALVAKRSLGRFPALRPGDPAPRYERLWRDALGGLSTDVTTRRGQLVDRLWTGAGSSQREHAVQGRLSTRIRLAAALTGGPRATPDSPSTVPVVGVVVVKTVHAPLALEWLVDRFPPVRVVVVLRHPANVLCSWRELALPDQDRALDQHPAVQRDYLTPWHVRPPPSADPVARAAWHVCLLTAALLDAAARHAEWVVVVHEDLCVAPVPRFSALAHELGLPWRNDAERFLQESDRPGDGFAVHRRASEQPDRWRSRLAPEGVRALATAAAQFPGLDRWAGELRCAAERDPSRVEDAVLEGATEPAETQEERPRPGEAP